MENVIVPIPLQIKLVITPGEVFPEIHTQFELSGEYSDDQGTALDLIIEPDMADEEYGIAGEEGSNADPETYLELASQFEALANYIRRRVAELRPT